MDYVAKDDLPAISFRGGSALHNRAFSTAKFISSKQI